MLTMSSFDIIKSLKNNEFSTVLKDIQLLISSEKKIDCSEICNILAALYQAIKPSPVEIDMDNAKKLVFDMIPCINLCIDYIQNAYLCSDLVKNQFFPILYHTIRTFLKFELYPTALSCGKILKTFLEDSENIFDDKISYIKNMSIIFWNDALHIEKKSDFIEFDTALALREASVEFLLLDKASIHNAFEKINLALIRYCQSNNIDPLKVVNFMQNIWSHIRQLSENYEYKASLFKNLQMWLDIVLKYLKEYSIMEHFLVWFQDLSKTCKKKEQKVLNICSGISKLCIQFFILQKCDTKLKKTCLNYNEFFENEIEVNKVDSEIIVHTRDIIYSSFVKFFKPKKNSADDNSLKFMISNIQVCVALVHYFITITEKIVQTDSSHLAYIKKLSVCQTLINLFITLIKKEHIDTKKKLINEAEKFVKLSHSKIMVIPETDDVGRSIIGFASCITRLAITLYSCNLYSESIYFFETADNIFSICSSLVEYKAEDTQLTLWKSHEVFVYASFLSGFHEKALLIIAKSLLIHENKTKECFDLWKKVKRDALRNGKDYVIPNIVSDFLLNINVEIDVEKEILYLLEEFKVCKAERCSLEEEIIVLSQKLLNMPLVNVDRAYILLEILTMPSNLSKEISVLLKKSLSEICLEAIKLYVDHLAENSKDYIVKLYLSIAYFWIYHHNFKEIHNIAEKEAQKILKPPSPKQDTKVQNDVEEENDTCDIQPVHSLVTLSVEAEIFKYLDLAIQLWECISESEWKDLSHIVKEKNVLDVIYAAAETYSTAVYEFKELKLWHLLQSVSVAVGNKPYELTACISLINLLIRLGYFNLALYFLKKIENECNKNECNSEFENIEIKFKLSKAYYFLQTEKFDDGLKILRDIIMSSALEKRFKSVKLLHAETLLLLSEYLCIPIKAFFNSENIEYLMISTPLAYLMESVSICKALLKHYSEKQTSCTNEFDWICFKPALIKSLLKSHLQLGELYFKSGDPRFARCYLQDGLKIAESHILTYWSSKILLVLGHIDIMCDNFKDCHVKTSGLKYIFDKNAKPSCFEILDHLRDEYSAAKFIEPLSPDSSDELVIATAPDIALPRHIKQEFIDKIDVMSSPLPKKQLKNSKKHIQFNFNEGNLSINLVQLESSLLSYLLSLTEAEAKWSDEILQELLIYYNEIKNMNILISLKVYFDITYDVEEPFLRLQSKHEVLFYISIHLQKLESYYIKNDVLSAKEIVKRVFYFMEKVSNYPRYSYPDTYALIKYHDIRVTLCDFYKIPLSSSLAYYICPSIKPNMHLKKKECEKYENIPNTPVGRKVPKIVIDEYKHKPKKCQAPLKKNLLNTNLKKDLECEISGPSSPFIFFSSSDENENFESPFNSLSRASKIRSGSKKISKKNDKNGDCSYQIFKQKNNTLEVRNASDVWNLCLTDTPKLGKENRSLRSSKTAFKSSQTLKKKTRSANSVSQQITKSSKVKSKKSKKNDIKSLNMNKLDESLKQTDTTSNFHSERKISIECSRSSPLDKVSETDVFPGSSSGNTLNPGFSSDITSSDNVFFSPLSNLQSTKVPNLIDDLCRDLSSLSLVKSLSSHFVVGNLEEVINELSELRLLIQNSMPYPLYANICRLLGVLLLVKRDGTWNDENLLHSSFLLSETFSISLRNIYISNMIYFKEPEFVKEKEFIIQTLKRTYCDIDHRMYSFFQVLPKNWTVIQVSAFQSEENFAVSDQIPCPTKLIISQYQKDLTPITVGTNCSSDERFHLSFLSEFGKILEESSLTMLNIDSKSWWETRSSLDARMKDLVRDMENIWLGCWKGLFLGIPQNEGRIEQLQTAVNAISDITPCKNKRLLQILVDSAQLLSREQVCAAVCYLWNCDHNNEIHNKLCRYIRHISIALPDTERHPLILILDQSIQDLPWECMPVMKGMPITRMPSLSILHTKLAMLESDSVLDRGFDTSKTYYVLNPGGDLTHSQEYFQDRFEKQMNWNGITGMPPSVADYVSGFKDHEFFIYCGHGSGKKYFEGTSVDKLRLQSTSVLMGCSSGKLRRLGKVLEGNGIVLKLLLCGCPSVTANLWDVTDKDIDRFTDKFFHSLIPNYDEDEDIKYNIAKAVSVARSNCKMRYLVGAAPVVYGFPVFAMSK